MPHGRPTGGNEMEITRELTADGVVILRLEGEMLGGPESDQITAAVADAISSGHHHILADLAGVPWMSSGGIGILTRVYTTLKNNQGRLRLVNASERVKKVLLVTGLIAIFEVHASEADALADFAPKGTG